MSANNNISIINSTEKHGSLLLLLIAVFVLTLFFRVSIVDGNSMQGTLSDGDMLILLCREYTLECGDIVVVQDDSTVLKHPIIKRIIAMGGQTVRITPTDIYVDGVKLEESYVYTGDYIDATGLSENYRYSVFPSDEIKDLVVDYVDGAYYEIVVPDGDLFLLGDHRNSSMDSREIGTVGEDTVIGKALIRFYPIDKIAITE